MYCILIKQDVNVCLKDETLEETGWKLVHGDVFRPPQRPKLLAAFVGSGIQLFCVTFIVIGNYLHHFNSDILHIFSVSNISKAALCG